MTTEISPITANKLSEYSKIPMTFEISSKFDVQLIENGLGGIKLSEVEVKPYVKDYDEMDGSKPTDWPKRFDISNWGLFLARNGEIPVAGAAVAFNTPEVNMLEGRNNLAVLWDLRVHPDYRGSGLGTKVFQKATGWAKSKGCTQMKVETQNTNVAACKFYARQGCQLGEVHRFKYTNNPKTKDEVMLIWYLDL
jgi:ribosomal protein S18 acetylase RimI-like enzyme